MRVLFFGTYERDYPRNAQVAAALRRAGVEVAERHEPVWTGGEQWRAGTRTVLRLLAAEVRLALGPRTDADAVLVGYPGHLDLAAARRVAGHAPVVFNPLVSLWETLVEDRGRFREGSAAARALRRLDRGALRAADLVVADTHANAEHMAELAGLARVEVCFVGAEERLFMPAEVEREPATVLFVGKLIPLHGLETILAAARLAPELRFRIVGDGQLRGLLDDRPLNVEHVPWVPYAELPGELHRATCALGVFGTSAKASRVIPNKAFQAIACATPIVTGDTAAARELLVDGESALLVPPGDAEALAAAVTRVCENAGDLGAGGLAAYREHASEEVLGRRWRSLIEALL